MLEIMVSQVKARGRVKAKVKARTTTKTRVGRIESAPFEFQPQAYYSCGPWKKKNRTLQSIT